MLLYIYGNSIVLISTDWKLMSDVILAAIGAAMFISVIYGFLRYRRDDDFADDESLRKRYMDILSGGSLLVVGMFAAFMVAKLIMEIAHIT